MADEQGNLKFVIAGVGGAGCNSIMRLKDTSFRQTSFLAINTDKKQLDLISNAKKLLIGKAFTKGLGAGGDPSIGQKAALASEKEIKKELEDADLIFLITGVGGGTGSGASPVIAQIAKENSEALVISFCYFPFKLERARIKKAQSAVAKLSDYSDTLILIEHDKLVNWAENVPINEAFKLADDVAAKAVEGILHTLLEPSLINLDFADLSAITKSKGLGMISYAQDSGPLKVHSLPEKALNNPLLEVDFSKASGALIHLTGDESLRLGDATEICEKITEKLSESASVCWGARIDQNKTDFIEALVLFTGVPSPLLLDPEKYNPNIL
ncbi:MAG: cell division protein FtsZ [Candidatus Micrarchaeota archaeon]|nr:cell division protein FtsZ [Candidatus Micrarchaeota archaeon]